MSGSSMRPRHSCAGTPQPRTSHAGVERHSAATRPGADRDVSMSSSEDIVLWSFEVRRRSLPFAALLSSVL